MTPTIRRKLEQLAERFEEVGALIAQPDAAADTNRFRALNREYAQLEPVAVALKAYDANETALTSARGLLKDPEMKELAEAEIPELEAAREKLDRNCGCC